jgi:Restriction endonuclease
MAKKKTPNWKEYEEKILEEYRYVYPDAIIKYDQRLKGQYSKRTRQIDILIEGHIAGDTFRVVVDCKHFNKKVDVRDIDLFIGLLDDVGADKGILITIKGYAAAAEQRALNSASRIDLEIVNYDVIHPFQSDGAIIYRSTAGCIVDAPFGWILTMGPIDNALAVLHQRGLKWEEAVKYGEFITCRVVPKSESMSCLEDITRSMRSTLRKSSGTLELLGDIVQADSRRLQIVRSRQENKSEIIFGAVEFNESIAYFNLATLDAHLEKNLKKLRDVLFRARPLRISYGEGVGAGV